jgi:hypothetical protein
VALAVVPVAVDLVSPAVFSVAVSVVAALPRLQRVSEILTGSALSAVLDLVVDVFHDSLQRCGRWLDRRFRAFEVLNPLAELAHFCRDRGQRLRERIVDLLGIGDHYAFAFAEDDVPGHADHGGVFGNISQDNRTRADAAVFPHGNVAEDFRSSADDYIVFDRGMALAVLLACAAQGHALVESHVVADDRRLADHDAVAVIDEQTASDLRSGMDFNSSEKTRGLRQHASQQERAMIPQPVIQAVKPDRMESGIAQIHFQAGLGRGIVFHHVGHVFAN